MGSARQSSSSNGFSDRKVIAHLVSSSQARD